MASVQPPIDNQNIAGIPRWGSRPSKAILGGGDFKICPVNDSRPHEKELGLLIRCQSTDGYL